MRISAGDGLGDVALDLAGLGDELGVSACLSREEDLEPTPVACHPLEVRLEAALDLLCGTGRAEAVALPTDSRNSPATSRRTSRKTRASSRSAGSTGLVTPAAPAISLMDVSWYPLGEHLEGDVEELLAALGGGESDGHWLPDGQQTAPAAAHRRGRGPPLRIPVWPVRSVAA